MKILIATHKELPVLHNEIFVPIQVNADKNPSIKGVNLKDNTGDHISEKNENYSELTALYWMWKNLENEDILGLFHYRRFLNTYNNFFIKPHRNREISGDSQLIKKLNNKYDKNISNILKWLKNNEVLVSYPQYFKIKEENWGKKDNNLKDDYCVYHVAEHWDIMVEVLLEKYPEYKKSVHKVFIKNNKIIGTNMFISEYAWLDKYCKWLFDILFEVEKRVSIPDDPYQKRVFGFMSERLMTLYLDYNKTKIKPLQRLQIKELF